MRNTKIKILVMVIGLCLTNLPAASANCPSADLTGDCFVDFEDFALMANQWLTGDANVPENMVYIPSGGFEMGDHYGDGFDDELPLHPVLLDSFFMSKFETTNQQYCDFLNSADVNVVGGVVYASTDTGNSYPYLDTNSVDVQSQITYGGGTFSVISRDGYSMAEHPVLDVSWYGSAAYCNWRSQQEGYESCYNLSTWECDFSKHGYRLPTEAEWEYAARGGCCDAYYKYSWCSNTIDCSKANYWSPSGPCNPLGLSGFPFTAPVGYYSANNFGLFDMTGNIWEWCNDWYDENYYETVTYDNPQGPSGGSYRVLRGGGWLHSAYYCRITIRGQNTPRYRVSSFGFRVVLAN